MKSESEFFQQEIGSELKSSASLLQDYSNNLIKINFEELSKTYIVVIHRTSIYSFIRLFQLVDQNLEDDSFFASANGLVNVNESNI